MSYLLRFAPELEEDLYSGFVWYEDKVKGLGDEFLTVKLHPGLRVPTLAERMATSAKNVERWLKQLKENGKVEYRGAAKTGGYYYLDADE